MVKVTRWNAVRLYKHSVRKVTTQVHAKEREREFIAQSRSSEMANKRREKKWPLEGTCSPFLLDQALHTIHELPTT